MYDESELVKTNVKTGGNAVASVGKGSSRSDNDVGKDDSMDDSQKQMSATKSSGTGTSNSSGDSCKRVSKSGENDSDVEVSANDTECIVDTNDAGYQSVVLTKKLGDDQENEEKKTRMTFQATMNPNQYKKRPKPGRRR